MIRRASFCLLRFQESGFKGIGENKALLALLKADGHISPVQLDHLAAAELSVSHSASNGNAGNIDLRFFGLLGRDATLTIPWEEIDKIGVDAVLVRTELPPPEPKPASFWQTLRHWLDG